MSTSRSTDRSIDSGPLLGANRSMASSHHITPLLAVVRRIVPRAAQRGVVWLPIAVAIGAAVPVPVRKLLRALAGPAAGQRELFG